MPFLCFPGSRPAPMSSAVATTDWPKTYTSAHFFMIYFTTDLKEKRSVGKINAEILGNAFQHIGYKVTVINEKDMGLDLVKEGTIKEKEAQLEKWCDEWLRKEYESLSEQDNQRLFGFCVFGHGQVFSDHLICSEGSLIYAIDLTQLQQIMRDRTRFDVFFLFECCDGAFNGLEPLAEDDPNYVDPKTSTKIVETLSAGEGIISTVNESSDFSQRFAFKLYEIGRLPQMRYSVRELFDLVKDDGFYNNPGHHRINHGQGSIALPMY